MPSRDINDCHPAMRELDTALKLEAEKRLGENIFLTCTHRSNAEQNALWLQGRPTGMIVTKARAGQSPHNTLPSNAFDFAILDDDGDVTWDALRYRRVARLAQLMGADCGAFWTRFRDNPHIQMPNWSIGKRYPIAYRFVKPLEPRTIGKPKIIVPAKPKSQKMYVFTAEDNMLIGYGTLVGDKVYIVSDGDIPLGERTSPAHAPSQLRGFSARSNNFLGMVSRVGDKVYITLEQRAKLYG